MGCGDEKLLKYLTQTFTAHCNAMICQQVTLSGDAEWPKVADAVIEACKTPVARSMGSGGRLHGPAHVRRRCCPAVSSSMWREAETSTNILWAGISQCRRDGWRCWRRV